MRWFILNEWDSLDELKTTVNERMHSNGRMGSLGHPFPNLKKNTMDIELKLTWKNKKESNKLNIKP